MTPEIQITNKHHGRKGNQPTFYIGRGSPLGNPYKVEDHGRGNAIMKYDNWLEDQINVKNPDVMGALETIAHAALQGPIKLECFCAPMACHGEVIKRRVCEAIRAAEK